MTARQADDSRRMDSSSEEQKLKEGILILRSWRFGQTGDTSGILAMAGLFLGLLLLWVRYLLPGEHMAEAPLFWMGGTLLLMFLVFSPLFFLFWGMETHYEARLAKLNYGKLLFNDPLRGWRKFWQVDRTFFWQLHGIMGLPFLLISSYIFATVLEGTDVSGAILSLLLSFLFFYLLLLFAVFQTLEAGSSVTVTSKGIDATDIIPHEIGEDRDFYLFTDIKVLVFEEMNGNFVTLSVETGQGCSDQLHIGDLGGFIAALQEALGPHWDQSFVVRTETNVPGVSGRRAVQHSGERRTEQRQLKRLPFVVQGFGVKARELYFLTLLTLLILDLSYLANVSMELDSETGRILEMVEDVAFFLGPLLLFLSLLFWWQETRYERGIRRDGFGRVLFRDPLRGVRKHWLIDRKDALGDALLWYGLLFLAVSFLVLIVWFSAPLALILFFFVSLPPVFMYYTWQRSHEKLSSVTVTSKGLDLSDELPGKDSAARQLFFFFKELDSIALQDTRAPLSVLELASAEGKRVRFHLGDLPGFINALKEALGEDWKELYRLSAQEQKKSITG